MGEMGRFSSVSFLISKFKQWNRKVEDIFRKEIKRFSVALHFQERQYTVND
jgi:hypothetical protein